MDKNKCLKSVIEWVKEVGEMQKAKYRTPLSIEQKSSKIDLVTEVDHASEKMLIDRIQALYPEHSILGEESGLNDKQSRYQWVIDPLDGTTNFAQGLPIFAISVALQMEGQTQLGVVYAPMINQLFTAIKGEGAYLNGVKIEVGKREKLPESVIATGFPYDRSTNTDNNAQYFAHLVPKVRGLRRMGAAAYDLAMVAAGGLDGYWELNLNIWDVAAGILLIEEAGGCIVPWENKRGIAVIAGNKNITYLLHKELAFVDLHMSEPPIS